jgi:anti-sigma factor RsiW
MTCPCTDDLSAYSDGVLTPSEQRAIARHLQTCTHCRQTVDGCVALRQGLRALPSPRLEFDLARHLEERLTHPSPKRRRRWRPQAGDWIRWMPAGLATGMALASGLWLGGLLVGGGSAAVARPSVSVRVFDPVPPGGLCTVSEICRLSKGMP